MHSARNGGKGHGDSILSQHLPASPRIHNPEALQNPSFWGFLEVSRPLSSQSPASQPPHPPGQRGETKSSNPLIKRLVPWDNLPSSTSAFPPKKNHLINTTKDTLMTLITQEIPGVLNSAARNGMKIKYIFLNYKSQYHMNYPSKVVIK